MNPPSDFHYMLYELRLIGIGMILGGLLTWLMV